MDEDAMDNAVLGRLCHSGPLTEEEIRRELGLRGADALDNLVAKGLAHRLDGDFVIPSAAGRHANQIDPSWA
jgi:hypothetical protein